MIITIFTPTYNRAKLLPRLYESLCQQTCTDFEWLIVDDGSTDETEQLCRSFKSDKFPIRYIKTGNHGKYVAINLGAQKAKGEWFFIVDSDDWLPERSIETIAEETETVSSPNIGVICGMKYFQNGHRVGGDSNFTTIECSPFDFRYKMNMKGDLAEVIRTDVLREFPFPVYDNEKFCPEALLFNRIGRKYLTHYFNKNIYLCEYQPDGLSANIVKIRKQSWRLSVLCYAEQAECPVPLSIKIRSWINFWRFLFCGKKVISNSPKFHMNVLSYLCMPLGWLMYLRDKKI